MTDIVSPMPATPGEVLDVRPVCQVVIGDFGRDAAVRYLSALSRSERRFLQGVLAPCGLPFFDEYRRITWVALAEVAFIKAELIESVRRRDGHLTDQVLLGEAWSAVPESVMEALVELVMTAVAAVVSRGYERVRVVLPCNSLGGMLTEVGRRVVGRLSADGLD
ncbi:MAG TPA: hypothetical protein VNU01_04340, partial [Egibacteraceae bacterium]|nr:hypothetical protein [Egibacteraceae bacterium]